MTTNPIEETYW